MMDVKELMSGIAVVIDDKVYGGSDTVPEADFESDLIKRIVHWFEQKWQVPFVKARKLPHKKQWPNLLQGTSFVLLDWKLWGDGGDILKKSMIQEIKDFLIAARENLVPVFIFTNENLDDVTDELDDLPVNVYGDPAEGTNFVFVEDKKKLWSGTSVDVGRLEKWVYGNASVYALKTWDRVLYGAKSELFQSMCGRSVNWPRVFWKAYATDGDVPNASLTNLISDSLRGRMRLDAFGDDQLGGKFDEVPDDELRKLIAETSFRLNEFLAADEIRCGDVYKRSKGRFWLNMRPDCDCIPRQGEQAGDVEIYCVQGKKLGPTDLDKMFDRKTGSFSERVFQSVAFGIVDGTSVLFDFKKLRVKKYDQVRDNRVGRLLHPYLTRIQQRYVLYMQRQALPRVPDSAVPKVPLSTSYGGTT